MGRLRAATSLAVTRDGKNRRKTSERVYVLLARKEGGLVVADEA